MSQRLPITFVADELSQLVAQRQARQISDWEFRTRKCQVLQLPPPGLNPTIRKLLSFLICNASLAALSLAFPAYTQLIGLAVAIGYLVIVGGWVASKIGPLERTRGKTRRELEQERNRKCFAKGRFW